mgnify:CR=1 FL=1
MEKENLQKEHQQVLTRLENKIQELEALQGKKAGYLHELLAEKGSRIDPDGCIYSWNYLEYLKSEIEKTNNRVVKLQDDVNLCFQAMLNKLQEEKGLEKLRENLAGAHNADVLRLLQKEIDEMAQQQYLHKQESRQ